MPSEGDVPKRGQNERGPGRCRCHVGVKQTLIPNQPARHPLHAMARQTFDVGGWRRRWGTPWTTTGATGGAELQCA